MTDLPSATDRPPEDVPRADRRFEVVLDELVLSDAGPPLPTDFTSRVLAARPFAPWEVRHARAWKVPVVAGGALLAGSLGLTVTPLLALGPETAATVWAELLSLGFARPAGTLVAAGPLLARAAGSVSASVTPGALFTLGALAGTLGLALVTLLGRRPAGVEPSRLASAPGGPSRPRDGRNG